MISTATRLRPAAVCVRCLFVAEALRALSAPHNATNLGAKRMSWRELHTCTNGTAHDRTHSTPHAGQRRDAAFKWGPSSVQTQTRQIIVEIVIHDRSFQTILR